MRLTAVVFMAFLISLPIVISLSGLGTEYGVPATRSVEWPWGGQGVDWGVNPARIRGRPRSASGMPEPRPKLTPSRPDSPLSASRKTEITCVSGDPFAEQSTNFTSEGGSPPRFTSRRFLSLMSEGRRLYKAGWSGLAMACFRQAAVEDPRAPEAFLWLGRAAMRSERYDEAAEALQKVLALDRGSMAKEARSLLQTIEGGIGQ